MPLRMFLASASHISAVEHYVYLKRPLTTDTFPLALPPRQ